MAWNGVLCCYKTWMYMESRRWYKNLDQYPFMVAIFKLSLSDVSESFRRGCTSFWAFITVGRWNSSLIKTCLSYGEANIILSLPIGGFDWGDRLAWHFNDFGTYSVSFGYLIALRIGCSVNLVVSEWGKERNC